MLAKPAVENLRRRISHLEEVHRRFSHIVPIADVVDCWLPQGGLSAGCIHEIKGTTLASAIVFSTILSSRLARDPKYIFYIAPDRSLHPLGLLPYGVKLDRIIHVSIRRSQDVAWAVLEALRCPQISSVIALLDGLDLTESRRLQLAAESTGVTGFLLGNSISAPIASPITRWKVSSANGRPGQRFDEPVWLLDLLYCRGGRPGKWMLEWRNQKLNGFSLQSVQPSHREALAG